MTEPVDLDALDECHADAIEWDDFLRFHNAYPAMAAELRALREVAEAARAFYGHVTELRVELLLLGRPCCDVDDSSLCEPTCRFNAIADALAKVPR